MSVRRSSPVLVGREACLVAIEQAIADRGRRPVILVGGEAGVGKSRLIAELLARSRAAGATATVGCCVQLGADHLPYSPFVDALGRYVEALGDVAHETIGRSAGDLAALVPELAAADASAASHRPEPGPIRPDPVKGGAAAVGGASRGHLYEAVRSLLDRAPAPLVLVLEDVHWADRSSLELLAYLAGRLRSGRTALVATFRTDELHRRHPLQPVLAELVRSGRATRIDVERLDATGVAELVRLIRGDAADTPDPLVQSILRRSGGNPFLIEELLAERPGPAAPLPGTLRDLLLARLTDLSEPARRLAGVVATVGRSTDVELLQATWAGSPADLDAATRELVDRAILVVEPGGGRLAFRHALIGEAVSDELLPGERVRLHAALAAVLADRPDLASPTRAGAAAEIAHHLFEAHDLAAACLAAVRAGDEAAAARAYPEAREQYERALDLLERGPAANVASSPDRIHLLLDAAAEASFHSGDAARAVALGRQAVADADRAEDPVRTAYVIGRLLEWSAATGALDELTALGERALELVPADPPTRERALALLSLASARATAGRHRASLALSRESARVAAACGAVGQEASATALIAMALTGLGRDREAIEAVDLAVELADRSRGTVEVGIAHIDRAAAYGVAGRHAELPRVLAHAREATDREGLHDMSEPWLATDELDLLTWQGRWDEAEAFASAAIDAHPPPAPLAWQLVGRGLIRIRRGRLVEGAGDLRAALDVRPSVEPEVRARAVGGLAEAALAGEQPRDALASVDEALAMLAPTDEVPGRAHLFALGLRAAADLAERARARRDAGGQAAAANAAGGYLPGLLAARDGRLVEDGGAEERVSSRVAWGLAEESRRAGAADPGAWASAAASLDAAGEPYLAACSRYREAEAVLAGRGERARAETILRGLRAWAAGTGAAPLLRDVEVLARRSRINPVGPPPPEAVPTAASRTEPADPYGLSDREREVLALLLDGRTNREIGAMLYITEKTASAHVTHILDKLGVTSRGAAAALAARAGLVPGQGG